MNDYLQLAIAGLIVAAVLFSVWKHGRNNPESTGRIARRLTKLEETVSSQGQRISGVEESVDRLREETATRGDVEAVRVAVERDRDINERTWNAVSRIQDFFIDKAISGGRR